MSKLTKFEKLFVISNALMWTANYVFDVIFAFYIWHHSKSLEKVIVYSIAYSFGSVIGSYIAVKLLQRFLSVKVRIFSIIFALLFVVLVLIISSKSLTTLLFLGGLYGLKAGVGYIPYKFIYQHQLNSESRKYYYSYSNAVYKIIMLFFPLLVTQILAHSGSYTMVFLTGLILYFLTCIPLVFSLKCAIPEIKTKLNFSGMLTEVKNSLNLKYLLALEFIIGIYEGFNLSIFSVIGLFIVKDIGKWGIIKTIITLFTIFLYYTVSKRINFSKAPIIYSSSALLFSVILIFFGIYLNFTFYILLLVAFALKDTIHDQAYNEISSKIMDRRIEYFEHLDEYLFLQDVFSFFGRIIPLAILFFLKSGFDNELGLSIVIFVIAFIPLTLTYVMERVPIVKRFRDPFIAA